VNSLADLQDSCFTDAGLNTLGNPYSYRVDFYTQGNTNTVFASSLAASTIYLRVSPSNQRNQLNWSENVPWNNVEYTIFRQNDQGGFDSLATQANSSYTDLDLQNGTAYCYLIRSLGNYGVDNLPEDIINRSQIACATPFDNEPPCPPMLEVDDICDEQVDCTDPRNLVNLLLWNNVNLDCASTDTRAYRVYYAPSINDALSPIDRIDGEGNTSYEHTPDFGIAGCYAVTAIDSVGNESALSNTVCVDNCPLYELPNTFTPNGDGRNDLFRPYPYCFIAQIELEVYNRWGQLVFTTTNPDIDWDGTNLNGDPLSEGTYVYTCRVFEQRVDGSVPQEQLLRGYIELIRDGN
jgi:gliding motility-associated-like protein